MSVVLSGARLHGLCSVSTLQPSRLLSGSLLYWILRSPLAIPLAERHFFQLYAVNALLAQWAASSLREGCFPDFCGHHVVVVVCMYSLFWLVNAFLGPSPRLIKKKKNSKESSVHLAIRFQMHSESGNWPYRFSETSTISSLNSNQTNMYNVPHIWRKTYS